MRPRVPNIDSFSCLIDRLAIENHKAACFEMAKREEHKRDNPDIKLIAKYDNLSREAVELRSAIKNRLDELLKEVIEGGEYNYLREPRTFSAAKCSAVSELIDIRYSQIGDMAVNGLLFKALEELFE